MDSNFPWGAVFPTSSMSKTLVMDLAISPNVFPRAALAGHHRRIVQILHDPWVLIRVVQKSSKTLKVVRGLKCRVNFQTLLTQYSC